MASSVSIRMSCCCAYLLAPAHAENWDCGSVEVVVVFDTFDRWVSAPSASTVSLSYTYMVLEEVVSSTVATGEAVAASAGGVS